jgi:hypothetical protein
MRAAPLLLAACTATGPGPVADDPGIGDRDVVAVMATASTTYDAGALATVRLDAPDAPRDVATLSGDAVVVVEDDAVFVIQRLGTDTVRRYAPGHWAEPVWEASTGRGSNPQDVAACGGVLFVSRLEAGSLLVLDPDDGSALGTVDLSGEADADGIPEAADLVVLGDRLLVAAQRLDRAHAWAPDPHGRVVAVDCATRAVVDAWDVGPDPVLVPAGGRAAVVAQDGVARIDADGGVEPTLADVDGAVVVDLALDADGRGAFVARDGDRHALGCLDGDVPTVLDVVDAYVADVALDDRGRAWFAVRQGWSDPDDLGGIRLVDLDGCADAGRVAPRLAPYAVAVY